MKKTDVIKIVKMVRKGLTKHSPEILTGLGVVGMITTTVLAVKATPKALELIEKAKEEKQEELTKVEVVKAAYKPYIPAVVTGVAAIGCVVSSNRVNAGRITSLATAYQLSTAALNEYKDKVIETVGEEKAQEIKEKIVEDKKEKTENAKTTYIITNEDDIIFYEPISNREFKSTVNEIDAAVNRANKRMTSGMEMYMSFNDFLDELNLPHSPIGYDIGWTANEWVDISYEPGRTEHDKPCFIIAYLQPPFHDFEAKY